MDIKSWFENGTGLKIKELRYLKPPTIPYFLFIDRKEHRGADYLNNIIEHNIIFERYSETNDKNDLQEIEKVNKFLKDEHYTFNTETEWLEDEKLYVTYWELDTFLEKIRKEKM